MDAERLILERAQEDFEESLAWLRARLRSPAAGHSALVAKAMEVGVMGAVSTLQLRPRYKDDVLFLIGLARRVNDGEDAASLARENLPRALRMRELALVARVKDPDFQRVLDLAQRVFAARLPDLARMVAVKDPKDYADLVRRAFPDEQHVVHFLRENHDVMTQIVEHLERHPRVLRVPASWLPSLAALAHEMIEWETERVVASVRAMYAAE